VILREALQSAVQTLHRAGIADAFIEAELLLGHVLGMSKTQLYTEPERRLTQAEAEHLRQLVQRRLNREPVPYILGRCEFYGIDFCIDHRTFIPRPETELLVEEAIEVAQGLFRPGKQTTFADIGTGCGAIAITLALTIPEAMIYAIDISASALEVAKVNCQRHGVEGRIDLLQGDLLEPLPEPVDMIVANLPYVREGELGELSPEVGFEPRLALAGGEDGVEKIQRLLEQMPGKVNSQWCLLLEIGQGEDEIVTRLVTRYFPQASIEMIPDLGGIPRVVKAVLRKEER